jgi:hypothetical protein
MNSPRSMLRPTSIRYWVTYKESSPPVYFTEVPPAIMQMKPNLSAVAEDDLGDQRAYCRCLKQQSPAVTSQALRFGALLPLGHY